MGGSTDQAPVVDDDAIWIGSSQGGNAGNSFRGSLDSIAIHRKVLDDSLMKGRFRRNDAAVKKPTLAKEIIPELGELPSGRVTITFHEGMPAHDRWLQEDETWPAISDDWSTDSFLLPRLPLQFDEAGIREAWNAPVLVRMAADVILEPGPRQFMLRAQGLSRLWVDGQIVARTKPIVGSPSGEEPITPIASPPRPGLRRAEHRQQEVFGEAVIAANGTCRVVLETIVGGKKFRPEPGELCVAISTSDGSSLILLQPSNQARLPSCLPMLRSNRSLIKSRANCMSRMTRTGVKRHRAKIDFGECVTSWRGRQSKPHRIAIGPSMA